MEIKSIDLSKKENTMSGYLAKYLHSMDKQTPEEILQLLVDAKKEGVKVSDQYLEKTIEHAKSLMHNKKALLRFIANIVLKGADLGVDRGAELEVLIKIYGTKDELIIKSVLLSL